MKANIKIKSTYIAAAVIVLSVVLNGVFIIRSANKSKEVLIAQIAAQSAIIETYNQATLSKLDGLKADQDVLNENDKIIDENIQKVNENVKTVNDKIDAQSEVLGLIQQDVDSFKSSLSELDQKIESNHESVLAKLEGLSNTLNALRKAGYDNVTAKQVIAYNKCISDTSYPASCRSILD